MPTKIAKKVSSKKPVVKKSEVINQGKVVAQTVTPEPGNPQVVQQLDTLVGLVELAKNYAVGDRSPASYSAEMDAIQKALDLVVEIRKSYD